ncbi:MAG: glycosyltransferase [Cyclobacteriaceae bacterium]|nr:glycosyltransferase [Cyclobacteriaceae bacterium]MCB0505676.1 glycosyltransferase [Cyclobacteriaceae bacterium]MCB9236646.1 glycosyltransferase [Flammeovirgaceae bacterium]
MKRILVFTGWYPSVENATQYTFVRQQVAMMNKYLPLTTNEKWKFVVWNKPAPTDIFNHLMRRPAKVSVWKDEEISIFTHQSVLLSHRLPMDQSFIHLRDMYTQFPSVLNELGGTPDLVWCVTLTSASLWNRFMEKNKLNIPFILQEHSVPLTMHLRHRWNLNEARRMLKRNSGVVVVAERQFAEFSKLDKSIKPHLIWNAVTEEFLSGTSKNKNLSNTFVFLFVGRLSDQKGLWRLIDATQKLVGNKLNFVIKLIGAGPDELRLRNYIKKKGTSDYFEWLGPKPSEEISREMDKAHAFVLPSFYENCPVALLEAQVMGLPCVCTINGASEKVLLPGNGIAVQDEGNGIALGNALAKMIKGYSHYDRAAIRKRSIAEFSPDVFVKKMYGVFVDAMR